MSSYKIEPMSVIAFLDENSFTLPRFQRKATWDKKQNFELCISIFQDYPIGVVIVNKEQDALSLLDGRQRRSALITMRDNPVELYKWAQNYIGFKKTEDESELSRLYWDKVEKFLQTEDFGKETNHTENEDDNVNCYSEEAEDIREEDSFNSVKQRKGLMTLLDIILMVHQIKPQGSKWERNFDFHTSSSRVKYAPQKNGNKIDPKLLRKFILTFIKEMKSEYNGQITQDTFIEYYMQNNIVTDEETFKKELNLRWVEINKSIDVIMRSESIFSEARIGIIYLTNASPLDAQNIFSRINKGGTQLKAEELLSAKPYWNKKVDNVPINVRERVKTLYEKLGIELPPTTVRWDIAATFIPRVNKEKLVFPTFAKQKEMDGLCMDEITLGFKLLSSIYQGGMANKHVIDMEKNIDIDWENGIDETANNIDKLCSILASDDLLKWLISWNMPIASLLGNAIALEFVSILLLDWLDKGKPQAGGKYKALQRDARILFDKLVFEYATRQWRGSGDSAMANHIKEWKNRIIPIPDENWATLIESVCKGMYNGQKTTVKTLRPILYYYYLLNEIVPLNQAGVSFDVDHIIPQELFKDNSLANETMKDSLVNLALLPKKANISKGSTVLNEITDPWLKTQIKVYENIEPKDFDRFSDIANIKDLIKVRGKLFKNTFSTVRKTKLSN